VGQPLAGANRVGGFFLSPKITDSSGYLFTLFSPLSVNVVTG